MSILQWLKEVFIGKKEIAPDINIKTNRTIYEMDETEAEEIHSLWDYLKFNENTQASHIASILSFDEWISMSEILRRIKELFGMDYKNDRSLYPYIKTMVDLGLVETNNVGGKKKWRKKDALIKIKVKKEEKEKEKEEVKEKTKSSN